ncbi:hypothetical protein HPB47_006890 [Ixodes persulcatus]|uniref:Uncharacterized protein n=1 Tax=Ixodes persulcatus TaxID=34615 RepID=A0AC60P9K0_IXOPE|nr:hypothetical protein HPB47_006890 [Ixodes persulcatus]
MPTLQDVPCSDKDAAWKLCAYLGSLDGRDKETTIVDQVTGEVPNDLGTYLTNYLKETFVSEESAAPQQDWPTTQTEEHSQEEVIGWVTILRALTHLETSTSQAWRLGRVVVNPEKGGNRKHLRNYRPPTVASTIYRAFARTVKENMATWAEGNGVLTAPGRSNTDTKWETELPKRVGEEEVLQWTEAANSNSTLRVYNISKNTISAEAQFYDNSLGSHLLFEARIRCRGITPLKTYRHRARPFHKPNCWRKHSDSNHLLRAVWRERGSNRKKEKETGGMVAKDESKVNAKDKEKVKEIRNSYKIIIIIRSTSCAKEEAYVVTLHKQEAVETK